MLWKLVVTIATLSTGSAFEAETAKPNKADNRRVFLLLVKSPVYLRLRVTLNGKPVSSVRKAFVDELIDLLDTDGDGKLIRRETVRSPYLTSSGQPRGNTGFFDVFRNNRAVPRKEIEQAIATIGGAVIDYKANRREAEDDLEVFKFLDSDNSQTLDAKEIEAATARLREKEIDEDGCVTLNEILAPNRNRNALLNTQQRQRPNTSGSDFFCPAAAKDLPDRMLRKYDRDNDKSLSAEELGWRAARFARIDRDSNGKLDSRELSSIIDTFADLSVAVRLGERPAGKEPVEVVECAGKTVEDKHANSSIGTFEFSGARLTLLYREVDPVPDSIANAEAAMNMFDGDKNGYLEPGEFSFQFPGGPAMLTAMDGDGDGRVFRDELIQYVTLRARPAATSCHLVLHDQGHGCFRTIDKNADDKISERELRIAPKLLASIDHDPKEGVRPTDAVQHVRIELSRGSFQFLGNFRVQRQVVVVQQSAKSPDGPIWFQRMDRNTDGDLTWNEFLGPREVFDRLDRDKDGLIDPDEAALAKQ